MQQRYDFPVIKVLYNTSKEYVMRGKEQGQQMEQIELKPEEGTQRNSGQHNIL